MKPEYYNKNGLSPIKAFEEGLLTNEEYIGFCKGNIIKYTIRAGEKGDDSTMDIIKAVDYLHYLNQALKIKKGTQNKDVLSDNISLDCGDDYDYLLNQLQEQLNKFKKEGELKKGLK